MKHLSFFAFLSIATLSIFCSFATQAAVRDGFFLEPFLTIEYSAPRFYGNTNGKHFETDSFFTQIKGFDNIAIGFHGRIHKYLGLNANWSQTNLSSSFLAGRSLSKKAEFAVDYYNFSALFFAPVVEDSIVELFAELGVSQMRSKISIFETNGNYTKNQRNETIPFAGLGFQVSPFDNSNDAFRFTFQRYLNKSKFIGAEFSNVRVGYIKSF